MQRSLAVEPVGRPHQAAVNGSPGGARAGDRPALGTLAASLPR